MYGKKFSPYGQFPANSNQLYEQEYEEEESEPMVEEIDESYEPTDRQVRQYAQETLGMRLPEDSAFLYLAREGLKAPLPDNWVPYQGRDEEVYYKHRITQEKTFDHPTDTQYRKKYEQQKEKMARKNLKSMGMKNPMLAGNSNILGIGPTPGLVNSSGFMGSSGLGQPEVSAKLDPRIEEEYGEELIKYEEKLKKEWREFEQEEQEKHLKKMKKNKEEFQDQLQQTLRGKGQEFKLQDKLRSEKQKKKQFLQEQMQSQLVLELREYERGLESKMGQFSSVYQEDNRVKSQKYQTQKDNEFEARQKKYQQRVENAGKLKQRKRKEREEVLAKLRVDFEKGRSDEIEKATLQTLEQELQKIKETYASKLRQKELQLERQYNETRRVLGFDQTAYLSELASKKNKMRAISCQKIESYKNKQMKSINIQFESQLDQASRQLREKIESQNARKLNEERVRQQKRVLREKQKIEMQIKTKGESQVENVYDQLKLKAKNYEGEMNKKLSTLNQRFITDIQDKSRGTSKDITTRLQLKQKEMTLENKNQTLLSLKRQQELELVTYNLLKLQRELSTCSDGYGIDQKLMKMAKNYQLQYKSDEYIQYETTYKQLKVRCRKDKQFLSSVMHSFQDYQKGSKVGSASLLKQYNNDVRTMRENEEMLRQFEVLLKKAEINDRAALEELARGGFQYKEIQLKTQISKQGITPSSIKELSQQTYMARREVPTTGREIETTLRQHSKFLSSMRGQLNRKLYSLRATSYY